MLVLRSLKPFDRGMHNIICYFFLKIVPNAYRFRLFSEKMFVLKCIFLIGTQLNLWIIL